MVTPVRAASRFYGAETSHQDYARRNPERYAAYRRGCGAMRFFVGVLGGG